MYARAHRRTAEEEARQGRSPPHPAGRGRRAAPLPREAASACSIPISKSALDCILAALRDRRHETILMHGVTGSGKTEVYIRAIEEVIQLRPAGDRPGAGNQPDAADPVSGSSSRFGQRRRAALAPDRRRAALALAADRAGRGAGRRRCPQRRLRPDAATSGLIVIDEEHDALVQAGRIAALPRPRRGPAAGRAGERAAGARHARRRRWKAGSRPLARPSSSLDRHAAPRRGPAAAGRGDDRPADRVPEPRQSRRRSAGRCSGRSSEALRDGGQVILLLNRRGFSTHIQCPACGHVVKCPHCDLSLTHHREDEQVDLPLLRFRDARPGPLPRLRVRRHSLRRLRHRAAGERRSKPAFPSVPCCGWTATRCRSPAATRRRSSEFRRGEVKILLGTQMIAKGLDFPNVTLVGVINADTALHFCRLPGRRADVSARHASRRPHGPRRQRGPRARADLLARSLRHPGRPRPRLRPLRRGRIAHAAGASLSAVRLADPPHRPRRKRTRSPSSSPKPPAEKLRTAIEAASIEHRLLGPAPCPIAKLRGLFRYHVLASSPAGDQLRAAVRTVTESLEPIEGVQWVVDVDPLDLL